MYSGPTRFLCSYLMYYKSADALDDRICFSERLQNCNKHAHSLMSFVVSVLLTLKVLLEILLKTFPDFVATLRNQILDISWESPADKSY